LPTDTGRGGAPGKCESRNRAGLLDRKFQVNENRRFKKITLHATQLNKERRKHDGHSFQYR
jgi:hypothetical protein